MVYGFWLRVVLKPFHWLLKDGISLLSGPFSFGKTTILEHFPVDVLTCFLKYSSSAIVKITEICDSILVIIYSKKLISISQGNFHGLK